MNNLEDVRLSLFGEAGELAVPTNDNFDNKVYNSILDAVGNTPLVRLNKVPKDHGLSCEIFVKCEFMNPGGSIKDRIGLTMTQDAKKAGIVHKDSIFVEPTSGNTGIGIALNAAIMENKCTLVMGEKNSNEKVGTMRSFGADVLIVKGEDEIATAKKLKHDDPDHVVILDQFDNMVNPMTHFEYTGMEILAALDKVDVVVMGAGTGGTMSGISHRLKQKFPDCVVVAVEPDGSILINPKARAHPYLIEGVGTSTPFNPTVLDRSVVDHIEIVTDQEAFLTARELARREGLLCGGSSGMAMCGALKAAKSLNLGEDKRMVVILPDGTRNYMSKFVTDQWMEAHLFIDPPQRDMSWWNKPITDIAVTHKYPLLPKDATCEIAYQTMKDSNIAVIVDEQRRFIGAVTKDHFRYAATNPSSLEVKNGEEFSFKDPVTKHLVRDCYTLAENGKKGMPTIGLLSRILDITPFVVTGKEKHIRDGYYFEPQGVITGDDVLKYIHDLDPSKHAKKF